VSLTRRDLLLAGCVLITSACTRPGSNSAPQRFGTSAAGPNVQVLDPRLRLAFPDGAVAPTTISSFQKALRVRVTVMRGLLGDLTDVGRADVSLVDDVTLARLIGEKLVEPIDRSLVANRKLLQAPFDDPAYDPSGHHSVPKDYVTAGFVVSTEIVPLPPATWRGFFRLARILPGQVAVPSDPDLVIGAALTAAGHDWNTSSTSDLSDASDLLLPLRGSLVVAGSPARGSLRSTLAAALCFGHGFVAPPLGIRFVVPRDGTLARVRCYCVQSYAPDPVSAHAWLDHTLDPTVAAAETRYTMRATPVGPAAYQLAPSILANPAVFPPALPATPIAFQNVDAKGAQLRTELWREFTLERRLGSRQ